MKNTVRYLRKGGLVLFVALAAICAMVVASFTPYVTPVATVSAAGGQGATLAYTEYQAENAATNGTILAPDRAFTHLAAEAVGRQAVQLTAQGQYVEFTLTKPANSIVLRYSVPDSSNGTGITAPLSLYVGGVRKPDLSLTSKYSWFYSSYPFSNDPNGGTPHHFFDEVHAMTGEMAAGTKVRVQVDAGDFAPSYTIDLADFEEVAAPIAQPANSLSITTYGADPTGAADSTTAINNAIAAAKSQGKTVWIPQGTFLSNTHIIVDNVTMQGAGMWYSTLHGSGIGVYGNYAPNPSANVHLSNFAIFGETIDRNDGAQVNGIGGAIGGGSTISNLWIEHTKVGMWFDGPFDGLTISGVRIRNQTADGINFHLGISHATVTQSDFRNTGDDGLAMWSEQQADHDDAFTFNTVVMPVLANNIAIYGGHDNSVTDNYVADTLTQGGGIHVGNRFSAVPLSGTTTIARNTLVRTGVLDPNWQFGVGAIWFWASDAALTGTVNVTDAEIDDSSYEAIHFIGSTISNVTFDHVNINKAGTFAVQEQANGSATFNYVTATGLGVGGTYNCGVGFTITAGPGNSGWQDTHCVNLNNPPPATVTPTVAGTPLPTATTGPTPTPLPTATPTPAPVTGTVVKAINAGGGASGNFVADTGFDSGTQFSDTSSSINTAGVANPAPQAVYQDCRWNASFSYTITGLTAGANYAINLHWAELSFQNAGARTFGVSINGSQVLSNFDVFATAGYKHALVKQFLTTANGSGQIVIAFTHGGADNPFINGIEIVQPSGGATPTPTATVKPTTAGPTATPKPSTPTPTATPAPVLVKAINAGGGANGSFSADTGFDSGNQFSDTSSSIDTTGVTNPAPQGVYQDCRWNASFTYTVTGLTAGTTYKVNLDWAELTFQYAGARTFGVSINGTAVLTNFDVYATAGYKHALTRQFTATANASGQIVIAFTHGGADNPFINGIEIYK